MRLNAIHMPSRLNRICCSNFHPFIDGFTIGENLHRNSSNPPNLDWDPHWGLTINPSAHQYRCVSSIFRMVTRTLSRYALPHLSLYRLPSITESHDRWESRTTCSDPQWYIRSHYRSAMIYTLHNIAVSIWDQRWLSMLTQKQVL